MSDRTVSLNHLHKPANQHECIEIWTKNYACSTRKSNHWL